MPVQLLPRDALLKTGRVDHADWSYQPILKLIQRKRFFLFRRLAGSRHFGNLLEIGYGSGIFMPELYQRCNALYGVDIHSRGKEVGEVLADHGVHARLLRGDAAALPFADGVFDGVVAISAIEFVENLTSACSEICRVLHRNGSLFVITPGSSRIVDFGLRILTGENGQRDYEKRRERVGPTLLRRFNIIKEIRFPKASWMPCIYRAIELVKKPGH